MVPELRGVVHARQRHGFRLKVAARLRVDHVPPEGTRVRGRGGMCARSPQVVHHTSILDELSCVLAGCQDEAMLSGCTWIDETYWPLDRRSLTCSSKRRRGRPLHRRRR